MHISEYFRINIKPPMVLAEIRMVNYLLTVMFSRPPCPVSFCGPCDSALIGER